MEMFQRYPKLDGTQEVLLIEDGILAARITAMAQAHLRGTHITLDRSQAACGPAIGLGLINLGLAILTMEGLLPEDEKRDLLRLIDDIVDSTNNQGDDDIPF